MELITYSFPMKKLIILCLALAACAPFQPSNPDPASVPLDERMKNPLFAQEYAKEMVNRLTELEISKDPILEDEKMAEYVQKTKREWKNKDRSARKLKRMGIYGSFIGVDEHVVGDSLLMQNYLYMGMNFISAPGPDLHVFLSEEVDPRDVNFPDPTSVDLGLMESPFGAHRYSVPIVENINRLRTAVLWDMKLNRLYGFAQLSP
jgi:hypothetical protein|tara:strand:- start:1754 stop:2368 length:615 start_codon:yes stop_codon:yes gene_type:complete